MKKEFNDLIHVVIPSLNECGNCGVEKCVYCHKFSYNCNMCCSAKCKNCFMFKSSKEFLMKNSDKQGQEYLANFLNDFFKVSKTTVNSFNLLIINDAVKKKTIFF